jgi:hypothetical protein
VLDKRHRDLECDSSRYKTAPWMPDLNVQEFVINTRVLATLPDIERGFLARALAEPYSKEWSRLQPAYYKRICADGRPYVEGLIGYLDRVGDQLKVVIETEAVYKRSLQLPEQRSIGVSDTTIYGSEFKTDCERLMLNPQRWMKDYTSHKVIALVVRKTPSNAVASAFAKVFVICTPENEDEERAKYEAIYHLYKDKLTLYSGDFTATYNLIKKKIYQECDTAIVYLIPRFIALTKVNKGRIDSALLLCTNIGVGCVHPEAMRSARAILFLNRFK